MPSPAGSPESDDPEKELLRKIRWCCARIIRGRHATDLVQVKWHRFQTVVTAVLSALAGAGIIVVQQGNQAANGGWITVGAVVALASGLLAGLHQAFGVEKTALQALSAHEAFTGLHAELEAAVAETRPAAAVNAAYESAKKLLRTYAAVIRLKVAPEAEVEEMFAGLVAERPVWKFTPVRRPRPVPPPGGNP